MNTSLNQLENCFALFKTPAHYGKGSHSIKIKSKTPSCVRDVMYEQKWTRFLQKRVYPKCARVKEIDLCFRDCHDSPKTKTRNIYFEKKSDLFENQVFVSDELFRQVEIVHISLQELFPNNRKIAAQSFDSRNRGFGFAA